MTAAVNLESRIQRLEDRAQLIELPARYCLAVDDRDVATLTNLYSPEGTFQHADGSVNESGTDNLIEFYTTRLATMGPTVHTVHSHVLDFVDADNARGTVQGHVELALEGKTVFGALRYNDRYARRGSGWVFTERVLSYWYQVPADELTQALVSTKRKWWPGAPVVTALPESAPTWHSFHGLA